MLQSPGDLVYLLRLLDSATWKFAESICSLELVEEGAPWIHRAFMSLPQRLPNLSTLKIRNTNSPDTQLSLRPCDYLKRLLSSSSRFRSVEELHVDGLAFRYSTELISWMSSFPALRCLFCTRLTSVHRPDSDHIPRVRVNYPLTEVIAVDCLLAPVVWLFLAPPINVKQTLRNRCTLARPCVGEESARLVATLLRAHGSVPYSFRTSLTKLSESDGTKCEYDPLIARAHVLTRSVLIPRHVEHIDSKHPREDRSAASEYITMLCDTFRQLVPLVFGHRTGFEVVKRTPGIQSPEAFRV